MTRKFYIITTPIEGTPTAVASKAITSPSADSGATGSQIDDIRNSGVQVFAHTTPGIWLRRASARSAAAYLTNATGNAYSVKEVGEFKRTVRPIKGYNIFRKDEYPSDPPLYVVSKAGSASEEFCRGESLTDRLIQTRAEARAILAEQRPYHKEAYGWDIKLVTAYADAA